MTGYRAVRTGVFLLITVFTAGVLAACTPASGQSGDGEADPTKALWSAVDSSDADAARQAIADGADIESRGPDDVTPVIAATKNNDVDVAHVLIDAGADVNAKDGLQDSAFLYSGAEGFDEILKMTIEAGADVRSINRYGGAALIPASEHGHGRTIPLLVAAGGPGDHLNSPGRAAPPEAGILHDGRPDHAGAPPRPPAAGADPSITEHGGLTARELAEQKGYDEIVAVIDAAA